MNAVSIWQPWASLIAFGHKKIETRSWHPGTYLEGEEIAIHAAKKDIGYDYFNHAERKLLDRVLPMTFWEKRPLGAVVATAILESVEQVDDIGSNRPGAGVRTGHLRIEDRIEIAFGDFAPGRFMWHLADVRRLSPPIPARGRPTRIFEWIPPKFLSHHLWR